MTRELAGLFAFAPVVSGSDVDFEGDFEGHGVAHFMADHIGVGFESGLGGFEDEFIVDLEEEFAGS